MKKSGLAVVAFTFLALAACGQKNQDQHNQADMNATTTDNLDMLANDAANQASEQDVLQNQQEQLNQEATDSAAGPKTPADENIAGM
jgi:ABC-type oligopeptide transport system substrate-binding subunit